MNIESKDLSIVVQGPNISNATVKCFNSLRRHFPEAELVFSTYKKTDTKNLDFDVLVESDDPGAARLYDSTYNNINRILQTTKAGLAKASKKYCIKIRSDLFFTNNSLLKDLRQKFDKFDPKFRIFQERVIFYPLWSRQSEMVLDKDKIICPFYLSDWLCFGLTEDLRLYFDASERTNEPAFSNYFKQPKNRLLPFYNPYKTWKFSPEQYFAVNFFSKYFPEAHMSSLQDVSEDKMELSHRLYASNIVIAGYHEIGVYTLKKFYRRVSKHINVLRGYWLGGVYRYGDFMDDYKKYVDPDFKIPLYYRMLNHLGSDTDFEKLYKHYHRFINPLKPFLRWAEQIFAIVLYGFKIFWNMFAGLIVNRKSNKL